MSGRKVLVLVEGQTEETFVREILAPHLLTNGVVIVPKILTTKWVNAGGHFKGGVTSYARTQDEIRRLLRDTSAALVTTMLDFYGLPRDFPGQSTKPPGSCYERVAHVEAELGRDIGDVRFVPHLMLHEFEALVFADPDACGWIYGSQSVVRQLRAIRDSFSSPEEIDEGPSTAPSKRLKSVFPDYQKTLHGPMAVLETGLPAVRARCTHFARWLSQLEAA